jgi:hypothetical protein
MKTFRATSLVLGLAVAAIVAAPRASGAQQTEKNACRDAHEESQLLRRNGELLNARQKLRLCAAESCPSVVRADCVEWLAQVEPTIPSIVLGAKDGSEEVFDVQVTMDGRPIAKQLDGKPIEVDPGVHTFRFMREGKPSIEQKTTVREGEKSHLVSATWNPLPLQPSATSSPTPERPAVPMYRPVPASVYVLGGIGVLGVASFAYFGITGNSKKNELASSCKPFCKDEDVSGVTSRYLIGDVSLGVGVGALLVGSVLLLTRPEVPVTETSEKASAASRVTVTGGLAPLPGGAAMSAVGTF